MAKRVSLSDMLAEPAAPAGGDVEDQAEHQAEPPAPAAPVKATPRSRTRRRPPAAAPPAAPAAGRARRAGPDPGEPRYLQMIAKEARLWPAQVAELDQLARDLNRARGRGHGERITSNTLIRVAAAWLVQHGAGQLHGATEAELAESLQLRRYPPK